MLALGGSLKRRWRWQPGFKLVCPMAETPAPLFCLLALSVWLAGRSSNDTSPTANTMLVPPAAAAPALPPSLPSLLATLALLADGAWYTSG